MSPKEQAVKEDFPNRVRRATESVRMFSDLMPTIGIVLGSGLAGVADAVSGTEVAFSQIEGYPAPTTVGHRGILKLSGTVALMAGRFHYYEGHTMDNVVLPVFLLYSLGVRTLILTNAAGAVNRSFAPADLIVISDHINLMGTNPLIGPNPVDYGPRFPDMSEVYSPELRAIARKAGGGSRKEGVYAGLLGPSYETPAEIRMLERLGADMVGMSTVPEAIAARYLGMNVLGISCITNMAAGILGKPLNHEEVVATGKRIESELARLVLSIVEILATHLA